MKAFAADVAPVANQQIACDFNLYVVAVLDLLGQKDQLAILDAAPKTDKDRRMQHTAIKRTVHVLDRYRRRFSEWFEIFSKSRYLDRPEFANLPDDRKQAIRAFKKPALKIQRFSDTIIAYSMVAGEDQALSLHGISATISSCAMLMFVGFPEKAVWRGAIEIGRATECWQGEVYGPALAKAHCLENEKADYPRVLIGKDLYALIEKARSSTSCDELSDVNRNAAQLCTNHICEDEDGLPIVDYLGHGMRDLVRPLRLPDWATMSLPQFVRRGEAFVRKEMDGFAASGNTKLSERYAKLFRYYTKRMYLW